MKIVIVGNNVKDFSRKLHDAKRVLKPPMCRSGINEIGHRQLMNMPKSLKWPTIEYGSFFGLDANEIVNGVSNFVKVLGHYASFFIASWLPASIWKCSTDAKWSIFPRDRPYLLADLRDRLHIGIDEIMRPAREILHGRATQIDSQVVVKRREDFLEMNRSIFRGFAQPIG